MELATLIDELEELLLAADGDAEAPRIRLNERLAGLDGDWPDGVCQVLVDNLELVFPDPHQAASDAARTDLLRTMAAAGLESMIIRDGLAAVCRREHASYPDPAGLIRALGILDGETPLPQVLRRWETFKLLAEKAVVWHDDWGLGRISRIDAFSDSVHIQFERPQSLTLAQCLAQIAVARPDGAAAALVAGTAGAFAPQTSPAAFDRELGEAFVPPVAVFEPLAKAVLVPAWLAEREFTRWRSAADSEDDGASATRHWSEARSLEELREGLEAAAGVEADEEARATVHRVLTFSHARTGSAALFAECVARLWSQCTQRQWLVDQLCGLPEQPAAWDQPARFVSICCRLPNRFLAAWLEPTAAVRGTDWLLERIVEMPLRLWPTAEQVCLGAGVSPRLLPDRVVELLRHGKASADAVLWLWREHGGDRRGEFANPKPVFQALMQTARGDFIRAHKQLHRLLIDDPELQRALMADGTSYGIANFIRTIKGIPLLAKGERQSLLVKIVRLYPEAREMVEQRRDQPRRAIGRITSFRSLEARRTELEEIINRKIPANSRAIAQARSYGDLRENAEYKAAKDEQRLLMARRAELERDLHSVVGTDFDDVQLGDTVIPGCTVELELDSGSRSYHLLGLWDSVPERNILSYDAPMGRVLLGHNIGDSVETPRDATARIVAIHELPEEIRLWVRGPEAEPHAER